MLATDGPRLSFTLSEPAGLDRVSNLCEDAPGQNMNPYLKTLHNKLQLEDGCT
jgi:hypothetical protein